jgi:DNA-binding response OmpR family regulator
VPRNDHILVVETDDLIRDLLERWLGDAGYTVIFGASQSSTGDQMPRLVIANISNPRGADALIESLQAMYAAPILALSARFRRGLGTSTDVARCLGVQKVLPKPFTRKELLTAVRESIGAR